MGNSLAARLQNRGGSQLDRLKAGKLWSLRCALKNSYNSKRIKVPNGSCWRALMNIESGGLKSDYDKKTVSVEFDSGLDCGDVFECLDDGTHWMIYLPVLTETAYLRSEIIRCRYTLDIDDVTYWVYFQGPTETDLRWFQKNGINVNELNLSGTIFIKKDARTENYFKRFTHIKIADHVWEVQVTDRITVPGIIELEVQEYYDNSIAELPEIVAEGCHEIEGREVVSQKDEIGYTIRDAYYDSGFSWSVDGNPRVEIIGTYDNGRMCKVKVHDGAIRGFTVHYGNGHKSYGMDVKIERRCREIHGPKIVYPYDSVEYKVHANGKFHVETNLAHIVSQDGSSCRIEVDSSKRGEFNLYFTEEESGTVVSLPITIGSL